MTVDNLSQMAFELSKRLEELQAMCASNPANAAEILTDALEELKISLEELSTADEELMQNNKEQIGNEKSLAAEQFRILAESIPHRLWSARPDGVSDYYNTSFLNYLGRTLEQMQGWAWLETLHPEDRQRSLDTWKDACANGKEYQIEYRIRRAADGQYRWHIGHALPLRDIDGQIIRWLGTCTDIDDLKKMEEALSRSEHKYSSILEHTRDGIVLADETGCIIEWNAGAENITGLDQANVLGRPIWEIQSSVAIDEVKTDGFVEAIRKAELDILSTGNSPLLNRPAEHAFQRPDGTRGVVEETVCAIPTENGFMVCSIMRDITERKKMEMSLQKVKDELERRVCERTTGQP